MTSGTLRFKWNSAVTEATIGPEGEWQSSDSTLAEYLNSLYPSTLGGAMCAGWALAFSRAVERLGAEVVTDAVPAPIVKDLLY